MTKVTHEDAVLVSTPYYVLIDGSRRIGPRVVPLPADSECMAVYGFSDKGPYDQFSRNSRTSFKPYPLVKLYLREQIDIPGDVLRLVVVDPVGLEDPLVQAATMRAVLEAQTNHATHIVATHHLAFDETTKTYRVKEESSQL